MDSDIPVTQLLNLAGAGQEAARDRLWTLLYSELHRLAAHQMSAEPAGQTLQPTALIHEVYLRLFAGESLEYDSRNHFFAVAAKVMRQIRVDAARRKKRLKRGGEKHREELDQQNPLFEVDHLEVLAVHELLERLEERDNVQAQVVELRYFAGLSIDETAAVLGVSPRTIVSEWRFARAWLHQQLKVDSNDGS